jgi:hypothetical protein
MKVTLEKTTAASTTKRINISQELAVRCQAPAAAQGMSVRAYIHQTLLRAVRHHLDSDEGNTKANHLTPFVPPEPLLWTPFKPEVIRVLKIQAALIGPEIQPAALVNAIVEHGIKVMTEQDLWWRPVLPEVVRFQSV